MRITYLILTLTAILMAQASARKARKVPSWQEIQDALLETWLEDDSEPIVEQKKVPASVLPVPQYLEDGQMVTVKPDPAFNKLDCNQAVNNLLFHITKPGSFFYIILNGWYLGQLGDFSSCEQSTTNGQYVLATVLGDYTGAFPFTRGSFGKSLDFSTQVGLCIPAQCNDNVEGTFEDIITRYALEAGWKPKAGQEKLEIEFKNASQYSIDVSKKLSAANYFGLILFASLLVMATVGALIQICPCGNKDIYDAEQIEKASLFRTSEQFEAVSLAKKNSWAQVFMALSIVRNTNKMNLGQRRKKHGHEIRAMNGIKSIATLIALWGSTIFFSWFSVLNDPVHMDSKLKSWLFTFTIGSSLYAIPILFFASGFLHAHSLLVKPEEERFTASSLKNYYLKRTVRFMPLLAGALILAMCVIPLLGAGPFWRNYDTIMDPCKSYWWTVMTFTNNLVPSGDDYDAKCFPFAWFIPCLVQLSLVTPIILYIYTKYSYNPDMANDRQSNQIVVRIFFTLIFILCLTACAVSTALSTNGPLPIRITPSTVPNAKINSLNTMSLSFYSEVYMLPIFQATSYFMGIVIACTYNRHRHEKKHNVQTDSITMTFINYVLENAMVRYVMYVLGLVLMAGMVCWLKPFIADAENQSSTNAILFNTFSTPLFLVGYLMIAMPVFFGKAALARVFHSCGFWRTFSNLCAAIGLMGPLVAYWFFFNYSKQLDFTYMQQLYYFEGNLVFTVGSGIFLALLFDKPLLAFINLKEDIEIANKNAALYGLVHKNYLEAEQELDGEIQEVAMAQPKLYQEIQPYLIDNINKLQLSGQERTGSLPAPVPQFTEADRRPTTTAGIGMNKNDDSFDQPDNSNFGGGNINNTLFTSAATADRSSAMGGALIEGPPRFTNNMNITAEDGDKQD